MRILVAEDDDFLAEGILMALRLSGHQVDRARTGTQATAAPAKNSYDLILLDLILPEMDGFDVLKSIRSRGLNIPVLVITAQHGDHYRERAFALGATDFLIKPFYLPDLESHIQLLTG